MRSLVARLSTMLIAGGVAAAATIGIAALPQMTFAQTTGCQYILGFATLHNLIPQQVGNCIDNQAFAANGDALQHTTGVNGGGGLLAWRKADNWTAFTDGYRTWINGPTGLVNRLNSGPLFPWENPTPPAPPAPPPPPAPVATPVPNYPFLSKGVNTPPINCSASSAQGQVACFDSVPNPASQYVSGHIMDKSGGAIAGIIVNENAYGNNYQTSSGPDGKWVINLSGNCPIEHRVYQLYVVDGQGHQSSDIHAITYDNCNTAGEFHFDFVRQS